MQEPDRLPLTQSLEANVRSAFAGTARPDGLSGERLLSALEDLKPQVTQTLIDALNDAGFKHPDTESAAVIAWVDASFSHWMSTYSLADGLRLLVVQLRPLAAAFALTDERFFTPGGHALHRFLDTIHRGFTGWQQDQKGIAGDLVLSLKTLIDRARQEFPSEPKVDSALAQLSEELDAHTAELTLQAPRLVEREWSALNEDALRLSVAAELNRVLASCEVPGSVARFMKSDWYQSGLRIASTHGLNSEDWQSFADTTHLLAQAVQPVSTGDANGQNRLQHTIQHLPGTLAKHLISLQPDQDAIAGAIGLIEYALLRNIRGEDLGLLRAEPIEIEGQPVQSAPDSDQLKQLGLLVGSWFSLDTPEGKKQLRVAGTIAENTQILFMDFLGARALRKPFKQISQELKSGEMINLTTADSFCLSMATVVDYQLQQLQQAREVNQHTTATQVRPEAETQAPLARQPSGDSPQPSEAESAAQEVSTPASTHKAQEQRIATEKPFTGQTVVKLQIPMGTWLGFHDREPPMMARVAVRDMEKDSYIFTNRDGIKLRELTVAQLIALIDRDMVDILDRTTNFKDTVAQMRQDQERLGAQSV